MKAIKAIFLTTLLAAFPACSQASSVSTTDTKAIEQIINDYIMENPEIIKNALIALEEKENWDSIDSVKSAIYNESRDVVIGPDNAKVTIVEFFDYNCSYCKRSTDWLIDTIDKHPGDVRVIFKELPILDSRSKTSRTAAKAALAAHRQGKYLEMHIALMNARGLNDERIDKLAADLGINVKKMRQDMKDPDITDYLEDTMVMAQRIRPFSGTPFFIIGRDYVAGANIERLDEMLKTALKQN